MRISLTFTVTLLVMITGLSATDANNPPDLPVYNDTCNYFSEYASQTKCGDKCINSWGLCRCGNDTFANSEEQHCCIHT